MWTDEIDITYLDEGQKSRLEYSERVPPEAAGASRLAEPREPPPSGLAALTFSFPKL